MHKTAAATKQFSWQKWRQQQNQLESSFSDNTSETKPTRRCYCCRCNVWGHCVSLCIPTCTPKIETPALNISPDHLDPFSDSPSLHVAKQRGRAIPPLPGKRLKGAVFHQLIILNSFCIIYGLVTVIKNSFLVFFFFGGGLWGCLEDARWRQFPANPILFMWNEILLWCPSGEKTHTTQSCGEKLCVHMQYNIPNFSLLCSWMLMRA